MDYYLGIDLGSTSIKAVVYDHGGNVAARGDRPTEKKNLDAQHPEWIFWDPDQIWEGVAGAARDAVAGLDSPGSVKAIAVTGMGMDGVPVDADGNVLYPFISWHDPRTTPQYEWWIDNIGIERTFSIAGNPLWHINSALRILWMKEHKPEIIERADKWLLIEDFVNFRLTGRRVTDYSMASNFLLFDQCRHEWSEQLLAASGIDRSLLCEALPSGTPVGEITAAAAEVTGLRQGTPVILGGHDYICGTLPVGAFRPGLALDVVGTWECIQLALAEPNLTPAMQKTGMWVQSHVARDVWAVSGTTISAEMLEWWRREFNKHVQTPEPRRSGTEWDELMAAAAESGPGAGGVMFLPHMSGVTCPMIDAKSQGAFIGLTTSNTPGDMIRAILEGLDYQLLDILLRVEGATGLTLDKIVAVGGGTRNEFWMQNKANVIGRPIEIAEVEEASPLGAAMLAGIGIGGYQDVADAFEQVRKPSHMVQPDLKLSEQYARWFEVYRGLYPALKPLHHKMFDVKNE